jgi:transcriptional regulator with XRE-family HTH domain
VVEVKSLLGAYLKARRQLITPDDVGIPRGPRRRVPGLRREELALLAGISPEYYLRLEQGRDHHPSPQVLDAIASVLHLDADGVTYLHQLAQQVSKRPSRDGPEQAPVGVEQLIDQFPVPAFVQGRYMDVLAANRSARALSPRYQPGINLLRAVFLDPRDRELHLDWDRATEESVSGLRAIIGPELDDPRLNDLVGELSRRSERFRQLWAKQDVRGKMSGTSRMQHPVAGLLELRTEKFVVTGADRQLMVVYHADPGTRSYEALQELASRAGQTRSSLPN